MGPGGDIVFYRESNGTAAITVSTVILLGLSGLMKVVRIIRVVLPPFKGTAIVIVIMDFGFL